MCIEAYGADGAIAVCEKYSYQFVVALLGQTAQLRKDPEEKEKEDIQDWVEENKERSIQVKTDDGNTKKFNLKSFAAVS